LVALDGVVVARGPDGERRFLVEDLYRLPGDSPHLEHTIKPGEMIVAVEVPHGAYTKRARYLKVRDRASYEFALVSVAAALEIEGGVIRAARIAAGGVGTKPWRMRASEAALAGRQADRSAWVAAADRAIEGARPLSGNRYKVELLRRTVIRALEMSGDAA
jgi:xanthine dehydrogenase YagS FAD-binding subunit